MSRDGAGTYNLPPGNPVVTESVISSTTHNTTMADVATALTQSISRDGQTTYTSNQSMGGFKHTQVADATARNQYATAAQVQDGNLTLISAVSGTDTITGTISPAISAYANGVFLTLIPVNNNTGPVTLNLNGIGAKPVLKFNSVPLVAGDLLAAVPATIVYNGTSFYLENPQVVATDVARLSQPNNFTTNNTFSVAATAAAPSVKLASSLPIASLENTAAPADARSWLNFVNVSGSWVLRADNDAHSSFFDVITAARTGVSTLTLALAATNITLNGINVTDLARKSTTNVFGLAQTVGAASGSHVQIDGNAGNTGFIAFHASDGTRRGYIGTNVGTDTMIVADPGFNWRFGQAPSINGTLVTDAAVLTSGTLANARVASSNVTQHQSSLALNASQITASPTTINGDGAINSTQAGALAICDSASTITLTVAANCLGANGKAALFIRRGTGAVTFSASGVTIRSPGGGLSITIQHGKAALIQITSTEFEIAGNV